MKLEGLVLFSLLCISTLMNAQQFINETIEHDGLDREYIIYAPTDFDQIDKLPLVLNFHGFGSNAGEQTFYGDFRAIADREKFLVVHPEGTELQGMQHWNVGTWTIGSTTDDVGFTEKLIDYLITNYKVDPERVYCTGMSNGGYMSYLLACQLGDKVAAIASVTGSMTPDTYDNCNPSHPTPVLQIHGTDDETVPYDGADFSKSMDEVLAYWQNYNQCDDTPSVTEIEDINMVDNTQVEFYAYGNCNENVAVEHFKILGGTHTWPGSIINFAGTNYDINASEEIWAFFDRYDINGFRDITSSQTNLETELFNISPNPFEDNVTLEFESNDRRTIRIYNTNGSLLLEKSSSSSREILALHHLESGIYIIQVNNRNFKLVKS